MKYAIYDKVRSGYLEGAAQGEIVWGRSGKGINKAYLYDSYEQAVTNAKRLVTLYKTHGNPTTSPPELTVHAVNLIVESIGVEVYK